MVKVGVGGEGRREGEYLGVEWRGRGLAGGVKFKYLPDDEVLFYNSFVLPS